MFNWLFNFINNALNSESSVPALSVFESTPLNSDYTSNFDSFERFDNFGCGASFQVSAEASYIDETRSHDFTTTSFGDSLSSDWSVSSFGSSWD